MKQLPIKITLKNENNSKIINNIKDWFYKLIYIIEFLISIPFASYMVKILYYKQYYNIVYKNEIIICAITAIILLALIILNTIKKKDKLEHLFLTFAIPISVMYCVFIVPGAVPDEDVHIVRSYNIAMGNIIEYREDKNIDKVQMPLNLINCFKKENLSYINMFSNLEENNSNYNETKEYNAYAQSYFPTLYIPTSTGMFLAKLININPIIMLYIAKLFNVIAFLILGYFSIKLIPVGKLLLCAYLFMPMILQQSVSFSADAITNMIIIFFISLTLYYVYRKEKMNMIEEIFYYGIILLISLHKIVYVPLILLSLLLLKNENYSKKQTKRVIIISTLIGIIASIGWYIFAINNYPDVRSYMFVNNVKPIEQIKYILMNPISFISVIGNTLGKNSEDILLTLFGSRLGWQDIQINIATIVGFIILIVLSPFFGNDKEKKLDKKSKGVLIGISLVTSILILSALYVGWSSIGDNLIYGLQGRYFIPVLILLLVALCNREDRKYMVYKNINIIYMILLSLLNLSVLSIIFEHFLIV